MKLNIFITILIMSIFYYSQSCANINSKNLENSHWHGGSIFDLHIVNQERIDILFTPSCMIGFDVKENDGFYELYYKEIDCLLDKGFYNFENNKKNIFAKMTIKEGDELTFQYVDEFFLENVKQQFTEGFFPNKFQRKNY